MNKQMTNRRRFIKQVAAAGILGSIPDVLLPLNSPANNKIWAILLHLSFNMWEDYIAPERISRGYRPFLRLSESLWNEAREKMVKEKLNMVVIDLGDAIKYKSHPEIAIKDAWSTLRLRNELAKFREMGLEPIPKLNFSTGHDTWLGKYARMVSTETYYSVCKDLIEEVIDLFDKPRFFHLGMDEEDAEHQRFYQYIVVRQFDLWWNDFYFLTGEVEKNGSRPWIWSDYIWKYPEQFLQKMPKSVLQSNWYYRNTFDDEKLPQLKAYTEMETHGYDQIPAGTSFYKDNQQNMLNNVQYCAQHISDSRLMGFLQTPWVATIDENRELLLNGIELLGNAKNWYETNHK
jgi:hypothetical protein